MSKLRTAAVAIGALVLSSSLAIAQTPPPTAPDAGRTPTSTKTPKKGRKSGKKKRAGKKKGAKKPASTTTRP
jgi:hypothetical protein